MENNSLNLQPYHHQLPFAKNEGWNQPDILWEVFGYTDLDNLKQLASVSKALYNMVHSKIFQRYFVDPSTKKEFVINNPECPSLLDDTMHYLYIKNFNPLLVKVFSVYDYDFTKENNYPLDFFPAHYPNISKFSVINCTLKKDISVLAQFKYLEQLQFKSNRNKKSAQFNFSFTNSMPFLTELNLEKSDNNPASWNFFTKEHFNYTFKSGHQYEGSFKNGWMQRGLLKEADGTLYEGDFLKGAKHGHGKETYRNGDTYEGEYQGGSKHGKGILTRIKGDRYEGGFVDGWKHGHGKETYRNGDICEGEYRGGLMHGHGKEIFFKEIYEGDFKYGKRHGKGTLIRFNEYVYEGDFFDGLPSDDPANPWLTTEGNFEDGKPS